MNTYYQVCMLPGKKTSKQAIHNSGANNVQLALNPAKEIVSLECDESKAGSSGLIVSNCSNKIKPSSGSYYVNNVDNILQTTKSTAIEKKTLPETGLKEQVENSTTVKQEGQIKNSNSIFCTDKSKVRLKSLF